MNYTRITLKTLILNIFIYGNKFNFIIFNNNFYINHYVNFNNKNYLYWKKNNL